MSHFQYTAWPDHGIPDVPDGILGMMELARQKQGNQTDPVVIHCRSVSHTHRRLRVFSVPLTNDPSAHENSSGRVRPCCWGAGLYSSGSMHFNGTI